MLAALGVASLLSGAAAKCPFGHNTDNLAMRMEDPSARAGADYVAQLRAVDWAGVRADLRGLTFTDTTNDPQAWPADFGSYGGLFVRLAWHCAGSYRRSDGRGGCDGGRIRYDPERSWPDNVNLDKALSLLAPIKAKYGDGLSWSDLIILSGTIGMEAMDTLGHGLQFGFCAGRVDDFNGDASEALGPGALQEELFPCEPFDGQCQAPLGPTTLGDIYVNPTGQEQEDGSNSPNPQYSANDIRSSFKRMGMDDRETLVLGAAGHTFGMAHGMCTGGPGDLPKDNPLNPWGNRCADGGVVSSGLNGAWTFNPDRWDDDYLLYLLEFNWTETTSPAGARQFFISEENNVLPIRGRGGNDREGNPLVMFVSDLAFKVDDAYRVIAEDFHYGNPNFPVTPAYTCVDPANCGFEAFQQAYIDAWYKLVTRDMGPWERCEWVFGETPPQQWQYQLPAAPANPAPQAQVVERIRAMLIANTGGQAPDMVNGAPRNHAILTELAFRCSATFRVSDFIGGCSGSRVRHAPQKLWNENKGIQFTGTEGIALLDDIKAEFPSWSWADLIVLAGQVALEATVPDMGLDDFCPGRGDLETERANFENINQLYSKDLEPRVYVNAVTGFNDMARLWGVSDRDALLLMARPRSVVIQQARGYSGSWSTNPTLSNEYFNVLLGDTSRGLRRVWTETIRPNGRLEFQSDGLFMTDMDMVLLARADLLTMVQDYAADNDLFLRDFAAAWTLMVTNDRFDGPLGNKCRRGPTPGPTDAPPAPPQQGSAVSDVGIASLLIAAGVIVGGGMGVWYNKMFGAKPSQTDYMNMNAP